jgi:hypothetical protein
MTQGLLASRTGASPRTVRNWERAAGTIKPRYEQRIADLRDIVLILEDSLTTKGLSQWLKARHRLLGGRTATEALAAGDYEAVRDAALAYASGSCDILARHPASGTLLVRFVNEKQEGVGFGFQVRIEGDVE